MNERARRLAPLGLLIAMSLLPGTAMADAEPPPSAIGFVVHRDGTPIGTHRVSFHRETGPDGEWLIVDSAIDIKVRAAFVTLYRYTFKGRETWRNGKLLAFDGATDDDGTKLQVHVRATAAGLEVDATDVHYMAPADTLPDSYWRPDTVKHQHFIDTEDGRLIDMISTPAGHRTMTVAGKPVELSIYRVTGEIDGEIGYGTDGQWLSLRFLSHGSDILYTLEPQ